MSTDLRETMRGDLPHLPAKRVSLCEAVIALFLCLGLPRLLLAQAAVTPVSPPDQRNTEIDKPAPLYTYALTHDGTPQSYDEAMAVASLQGIINRESPTLYVQSPKNDRPRYWLDLFLKQEGWLAGRELKPVTDVSSLLELAGTRLRGAVIWDPQVPASLNVATTVAGVEDGVVLSPSYANQYLDKWRLPVIADLRGRFTGAETGSKKNDAYRWAIREYLAKGRCSAHLLCLYEDSFATRDRGEIGYVVTRDWAVKNRSFVFDLSPWGDEAPADDPQQSLGLDLETYKLILADTLRATAGKLMTELTGFFVFTKYANVPGHKSAHEPVPTEWETVYLITPYNVYQNTSSSDCFNQSLHSHAPRLPLRQHRPSGKQRIENKTYLCLLMADYDSSYALYDLLPKFWDDPNRGKLPLVWGVNPNLLETHPDVIAHLYRTLTPADSIQADASAAGYFNPNRVKAEYLPLFVRHNQAFFREADQSVAPMVLDWSAPSAAVKNAYRQFAPDGFGSMVWDMHASVGDPVQPHVWEGMPVLELINDANEFPGPEKTARLIADAIKSRGSQRPGFYFFRLVWTSPTNVIKMLAELRRQEPDLDLEVLDVYSFMAKFKEHQTLQKAGNTASDNALPTHE